MENFENFFFQYVHKIQKIFGIMKKKILKFSLNSEQETISCNFFNYREALPPYTSVFVDDPTSLTGASVLRPWNRRSDAAKDNRLKLQSTGSRVLLLISVSESGLISEFFTSNLLRFYTNFTGAFFHDSNYFLTFYLLWTPYLSFAPIFMKDAQCPESNKKSIFRFLFFELSWKFIENWQFLVQKGP